MTIAFRHSDIATLMARVHSIGTVLRDNAAQADRERRVPEATIAALDQAGVFGINTLAANGGHEAGARALLDVTTAIGTYCPNAAWITVISSVSSLLPMRFPASVQERIFCDRRPVRMASVIVSAGNSMAVRDGEGYRITGEWPFGSNILNSDWAIGVVQIRESAEAEPQPGFMVMHRDQFTIKDTWFTIGMRGTGSNNFLAHDQWIPADQVIGAGALVGPAMESAAEAHFLQRLTPLSMFPTVILSGPLGAAKTALALTAQAAEKRGITYSKYHPQNTSGVFVHGIGAARAKVEAAELSLQRAADMIDTAAAGTVPLSPGDRAHIRNLCAHAAHSLADAVNDIAWLHGTATFSEASQIGRLWRDVNTGVRHAIAASPLGYEIGGAGYLGIEPPSPLV